MEAGRPREAIRAFFVLFAQKKMEWFSFFANCNTTGKVVVSNY